MSDQIPTIHFDTISKLHHGIGIAKPRHPLFSIFRFEDFPVFKNEQRVRLMSDFYQITLKKECPCKIQYGHTIFDFDEGVISCFSPKQIYIIDEDFKPATSGWQLSIHPDFLRTHPLGQKISKLGFFDYEITEALILSDDEQRSIESIFEQIEREYHLPIDNFSQDVIIAHLDVLLSYCNRYYNRQFNTRKINHSQMLNRIEYLLNSWFEVNNARGLPTAAYLARELNLSSKYLSDCLKQLTGQTTQQIIHNKLIEQAKVILTTTELSISEIAYQLGFEYSQSFSNLFKKKTAQTPVEYRATFN
ncbi:transcriptional regulator, AraC family protein [Pedobacter sp. BAL39]|uniref:helix-turn-helix domain-containing protein n=1 Tax=Pedobacter sp. BAL39 TaxID=391596 RepID=UPI0001559EC6|nr:AraC family transcriptional regulator [Pedobacter sp. BAL39]EDM37848.1 transcriptional regulator, AraC family protein [Pedobacter sp. BAL39]